VHAIPILSTDIFFIKSFKCAANKCYVTYERTFYFNTKEHSVYNLWKKFQDHVHSNIKHHMEEVIFRQKHSVILSSGYYVYISTIWTTVTTCFGCIVLQNDHIKEFKFTLNGECLQVSLAICDQ
jgi:hypothetical protein